MKISLANINFTLSGVQYQKKKKKFLDFQNFYDKKQNVYIMLNE